MFELEDEFLEELELAIALVSTLLVSLESFTFNTFFFFFFSFKGVCLYLRLNMSSYIRNALLLLLQFF